MRSKNRNSKTRPAIQITAYSFLTNGKQKKKHHKYTTNNTKPTKKNYKIMYLFFRSSWSVRKAIHCQPRWPSIKNWATVSFKQPTIINFIELFTFMKVLLVTVFSKAKLSKHFVAAILQKKIWAVGFEPEGLLRSSRIG